MLNYNGCYSKRLNIIISKFPIADFFKAIFSFFDTTSGTMNTDLFIDLSNCLSQTQPDGVFQNQINFRLIHSGPTPVSWLFALRHQPNWCEVVNSGENRFLHIKGKKVVQVCGGSPCPEKSVGHRERPILRPDQHFAVSKSSGGNFLLDPNRIMVNFTSNIHNALRWFQ